MAGGLSTANFMDGVMKGASFVQGMQDRQEASTLRQAASQRAQETHDTNQQIRAIQLRDMNDAHAEKMNKALAWSMHSAANAPKEVQDFIRAHPNLDAQRLLSDDYGKAAQTGIDALEGKIPYDHPDVAKAMDMLFPEIQAGATQGRKVSTSRLYPGQTPGTVMIGLKVEGDPQERPLTEGRGSEPNAKVKELHVDDAIGRLHAITSYRDYLKTPEGRNAFVQQYIGPDLAKQQRELSKENRESALTTARTEAEKARAAKYNHEAQKPFTDGDGKGGAGGTQRQKDYKFAIDVLGKSPDDAEEWAGSHGSLTKEAHEFARRMIGSDTQNGKEKPDGYNSVDQYNQYYDTFIAKYKNYKPKDAAGGAQPAPGDAQGATSAGSPDENRRVPPALRTAPPPNASVPASTLSVMPKPQPKPAPISQQEALKRIKSANPKWDDAKVKAYYRHLGGQ